MVAITGAAGFIGRHLTSRLTASGHEIRALPRGNTNVDGANAVIHLAGENIAQRWTKAAKARIRSSRIDGTRALVSPIVNASHRPSVLLCASAVGIYGSRGDQILTEASSPGDGFLADLTIEWEAAARAADTLGVRVVHLRFGVVLGRDGGAYPKMARPFRLGVGGRLGSGKQWMPWIHIDDVVNLIVLALENDSVRGPLNVTSPSPATNADFTRSLTLIASARFYDGTSFRLGARSGRNVGCASLEHSSCAGSGLSRWIHVPLPGPRSRFGPPGCPGSGPKFVTSGAPGPNLRTRTRKINALRLVCCAHFRSPNGTADKLRDRPLPLLDRGNGPGASCAVSPCSSHWRDGSDDSRQIRRRFAGKA